MDPTEGYEAIGYAAHDPQGDLQPFNSSAGPDDVVLEVKYCGICHAEIVWTKNYLGDVQYPVVPGHEVTGVVKEVGKNVTRFKAGDHVGVGYYVMSCRECGLCEENHENSCKGGVRQFNAIDFDETITRGGFSTFQVTNQRYVVHVPEPLKLENAAPLSCAGITVFSLLKLHGLYKGGKHVGVSGLGGLGHLAVKFAKAMGDRVTVMSTSDSKEKEALNELGADEFIISKDEKAMAKWGMMWRSAGSREHGHYTVIDCASGVHPLDPFLALLKHRGVLVLVCVPPAELKFSAIYPVTGRSSIEGSRTGGTVELQEMLNFAAEKGVEPMIETIPIDYVNTAYKRLQNNDVRYRFEIDIEKSLKPLIKS